MQSLPERNPKTSLVPRTSLEVSIGGRSPDMLKLILLFQKKLSRWLHISSRILPLLWAGCFFYSIALRPITAQAASSVTLAWDANSEPDVAGYKVYFGTSSGNYSAVIDTGNVTTAVLSNLTAGTTYFAVVAAYSTDGIESLPSSEVSFTAVDPPNATTLAATSITGTGVTLNGTVNANGQSIVVFFDYGTTANYGATAQAAPTPLTVIGETAVSATLVGLNLGTTYHFRVNGMGGSGTISGSDLTFTTLTALEQWRLNYYGTTSDSGNAASTADPYSKGIPNLVAFAFLGTGQNPNTASIALLPRPQMSDGNLFYSFIQPAGVNGVTYGAEWTDDLSSAVWNPIPDTGSGTMHTFSIPMGSNRNMFIRLKVTAMTTLDQWRLNYYGTTSDSGNAASTADPYGKGIPNLVAFAFLGTGQNPNTASIALLPRPQMSGGNVFYTFTQPAGVTGVTYGAEWTDDLSSAVWNPIPDTGSGTMHTFSMPMGSNRNMFIRLKVTTP